MQLSIGMVKPLLSEILKGDKNEIDELLISVTEHAFIEHDLRTYIINEGKAYRFPPIFKIII
jgi:hypothetical protein